MENEFTPITSQEALDNILKDRLNRQNEKHSKELAELKAQFSDYDDLKLASTEHEKQLSDLKNQLDDAQGKVNGYDSMIAERDAKIKAFEVRDQKVRIANEINLPLDAIEFLNGETEDEIRESAKHLSAITNKRVAPLAGTEGPVSDEKTMALKSMLQSLNS